MLSDHFTLADLKYNTTLIETLVPSCEGELLMSDQLGRYHEVLTYVLPHSLQYFRLDETSTESYDVKISQTLVYTTVCLKISTPHFSS